MAKKEKSQELSHDTKTLIVVITLLLLYPVGLFLMFRWMKWSLWVKLLIALPISLLLLAFIAMFFIGILVAVNPTEQVEKAKCVDVCSDAKDEKLCLRDCLYPVDQELSPETE